ncbi:hypothetical protein ACEN9X_17345 [Mucilaginibacter sp. Mucisp86]|uniref:hypothetical protein n=1 Tax=Mucilaginibacter sp. Mucisp86 TaxID=3243060 RepID=UPI0039B3FE8D
MKHVNVSDSNDFKEYYPLDHFYADPEVSQDLCRKIFSKLFSEQFDPYSLKGLFYTSINRYFLADIKILEHPLILQNLINFCKSEGYDSVNFKINKKNIELYNFCNGVLVKHQIKTTLQIHDSNSYWVNSLTTENASVRIKNGLKRFYTVFLQYFLLLANYLTSGKKYTFSNVLVWHSFANNREKIDYKFLDNMSDKGVTVIHPNPYIFKSSSNWNKSIYFLGKYSIAPLRFLRSAIQFISFRKKLNAILSEFQDLLPYYPVKWNSSNITKTYFFLFYNLLENDLVEKLASDLQIKVVNVFRGGSAAGLIYSGISKQKYNNPNVTSILVPHGTEFNVIDHFSYFFLDYNILPSVLIKNNWEEQLSTLYANYASFNHCKLIAGGRIDYELLNTNITKHQPEQGKIYVGIVLTYNSETYQDTYISDVKRLFEGAFGKGNCTFLIKPRPNRVFKPGSYMDDNVIVYEKDIYSFLNSIDVIVGTVSTFGILTMVVTDGIYCDIPGFYYIPNSQFDKNKLGYSYHQSMESYTFNNPDTLNDFLTECKDSKTLLSALSDRNSGTKDFLTFDRNANEFLSKLIIDKLNN